LRLDWVFEQVGADVKETADDRGAFRVTRCSNGHEFQLELVNSGRM
jgi:hypothetical protein